MYANTAYKDTAPDNALSIQGQRWVQRNYVERDALAITQQLNVPDIIGRILAGRGIGIKEAASFLQPTLRQLLPDPLHLKDMDKAARRIAEAIDQHVPGDPPAIAIFGDYDVDGATSSALLLRYFALLGVPAAAYIPDRLREGYGPNTAALLALKEKGAKLVITVDCGTLAFAPLLAARDAGLDVIVVDHHKGEAQMPACYAVVNPNRADETSPHGYLAACGVTFLLLVAVNKILRDSGRAVPDIRGVLDIVALGTICDVVPLVGANRALVTQGLKVMMKRGNTGIAALLDSARVQETIAAYHAGFVLGPRINAGGRVGQSDLGTRLLTTDNVEEARALAAQLEQFNTERRAIEALVQEEAFADAHALPPQDAVIVVARQGWHPGVIGIVAGRLKEHFHKPVAVIALDGESGKASARSISGVDLGEEVLAAVREEIVLGGGGHAMAAGFSITTDKLPALKAFFNRRLSTQVTRLAQERCLWLDASISLHGITVELVQMLEQMGPFGAGNPVVRLHIPHVKVIKADILGSDHIRAVVVDAAAQTHKEA